MSALSLEGREGPLGLWFVDFIETLLNDIWVTSTYVVICYRCAVRHDRPALPRSVNLNVYDLLDRLAVLGQ